jgi:hypothetical protein
MLTIAACSPSIKGTEDVTVIETADGAIIVDTKVTAVDVKKHKVPFQLADGTTKTVKALKVGDSVSIQVVTAEKPSSAPWSESPRRV